jgi:hypothetical protein
VLSHLLTNDHHHDHRENGGETPLTVQRELHPLALVVPLVVVVVVLSFCRRQINCPYYAPKVV